MLAYFRDYSYFQLTKTITSDKSEKQPEKILKRTTRTHKLVNMTFVSELMTT